MGGGEEGGAGGRVEGGGGRGEGEEEGLKEVKEEEEMEKIREGGGGEGGGGSGGARGGRRGGSQDSGIEGFRWKFAPLTVWSQVPPDRTESDWSTLTGCVHLVIQSNTHLTEFGGLTLPCSDGFQT